jgi:hypothetical protein
MLMKAARATERDAVVWLVGLNPGARVVRNAGLDQRLGRERMLFTPRGDRTLPGAAGNGWRHVLIGDAGSAPL